MIAVEIITPVGVAFKGEASEILLPTMEGQIGVLAGHRPLIATLKKGIVTVKSAGGDKKFTIDGGFTEITGTDVSVIVRKVESL